MKTTTSRCLIPIVFLALAGMIAGCGGDDTSTGSGGAGGSGGSAGTGGTGGTEDAGGGDTGEMKIKSSTGTWTVYPEPYGPDAGANPISATIMGTVDAFATGTKMRVKLSVTGLPPNRPFGSHIHKLACNDNKAGGHYQNIPAPDGGASDSMYANSVNEVWLDFTTDANGAGSAEAHVDWIPRAGEAKAVMIHTMATMEGGIAGAKLACTDMPF